MAVFAHGRRLMFGALSSCAVACGGATTDGGGPPQQVATQIVVVTQPGEGAYGAPLSTQPRVEIRDASGARVLTASLLVTASVASGGGVLSGTTSVTAVAGVATFTDLVITGSGAHTLTFSASGLTSATSLNFSVRPPGPFSIAVLTQPGSGINGVPLSAQPSIELLDITGARSLVTRTVSVSLSGAAGALSGTLTANVVDGVGSFSDLVVTSAASSSLFTLVFSSTGLAQATSAPFAVAVPATISTGASPLVLSQGGTMNVPTVVRDAAGTVIPNVPVTWASRATGQATVSTSGTITGVAKGQAVIAASVTHTAGVRDSVLAVVGDPAGAALHAGVSSFTLRRDTTLTVPIYVDMRALAQRLGAGNVTVTWSPTVLQYVSHASGAQATPVVNATNAATGSLRLSFADPGGQTGRVELLRITFTVRSTVSTTGTLALTATELSATDFSDLLAKLVQVTHPVAIR